MDVIIPKKIFISPELLILRETKECLDVKPKTNSITWTDQSGNEKSIQNLSDSHTSNLGPWLRERGYKIANKIIQGELERRCSGEYPDWFNTEVTKYKQNPEIWRLKVL